VKEIAARVVIRQGDLTEMDTDAIVNAANNDLVLALSCGCDPAQAGKQSNANAMPLGASRWVCGDHFAEFESQHVIHARAWDWQPYHGIPCGLPPSIPWRWLPSAAEDDCSRRWGREVAVSMKNRGDHAATAAEHLRNGARWKRLFCAICMNMARRGFRAHLERLQV